MTLNIKKTAWIEIDDDLYGWLDEKWNYRSEFSTQLTKHEIGERADFIILEIELVAYLIEQSPWQPSTDDADGQRFAAMVRQLKADGYEYAVLETATYSTETGEVLH